MEASQEMLDARVAGWIAGVGDFGCGGAEVQLPHVLSDHAVLQREQPVRIWGWSAAAKNVTVTFHEQSVSTAADAYGRWQVWLKPEKAGGPYTLDEGHALDNMLEGRTGNEKWMAKIQRREVAA